ncbi:IPT/TIG domain-containing protein [Chloroflexota bacterium]
MKYNKIFRLLSIAIVLSLLVVLPATPVWAAPIITLSPTSSSLGTTVTLTAEKFLSYAGDSVFIFFNDAEIGSRTVPSAGSFTTEFNIPDDAIPGTAWITVKDKDGNQLGDSVSFTIEEIKIELDPGNGTVGTIVTIDGKGFYANKSVTFHYNEEMRPPVGTGVATPTGECSCSFTIPDSTAGNHEIVARDALDNSAKADFKVISSGTLDPTSGAVGDMATVRGTGFGFKSYVTLYFNNAVIAYAKTNKYGNFEVAFNVPVLEPGIYTVEAEDEDGNTYKAKFTIVAAATFGPPTGYVGTELTVNGTGLIVGRTVTIKFDDTLVATDTVKPDGTFSATFKVPPSRYGEHNITASDGINTKQSIFTMESTAPTVPVPLKPEMGVKVESPVYFDWEDVTDPSGVTYTLQIASDEDFTFIVREKKVLTGSEYTITEEEKLEPVSKKALYYWHVKAIDGASNESVWSGTGSFYVGSSWAMPQWAIYTLFGIGALLLALFGLWLGRRTAYYSSY